MINFREPGGREFTPVYGKKQRLWGIRFLGGNEGEIFG